MNNLSSYCGLTDSGMRSSDTDLPYLLIKVRVSNYFKQYVKSLPTIWLLGSYVLPGYVGGQVQAGPPVLPPQAVPPIPHLGPQGF